MRAQNFSLLSFFALAIFPLLSCGGSQGTATPPVTYTSVSGNWQFDATSVTSGQPLSASAALTSNAGNVSGTMLILAPCFLYPSNPMAPAIGLTVSGTIDSGGNLKLVSPSFQGQVVTLTGLVSADGGTLSRGRYQIVGGCADKDSRTVTGFRVPNISGTYTGSATLANPSPGSPAIPITLTAAVTQATQALDNNFPLTGSIHVAGTPCFTSGTITRNTLAIPPSVGGIFGRNYTMIFTMNDGSELIMGGHVDPSGKILTAFFSVFGGLCAVDQGTGTMTRP